MNIDWMNLGLHVAMGIGLAACAGLRAFLPPLVLGIAARAELVTLSPAYDWLSSIPTLVVFAAAVVTEILSDKVPMVDHVLDVIGGFIKPVAGTIVAASVLTDLSPVAATVAGIVFGGGAAGVVHLTKAKIRVFSSVSTGGLGNPVLSIGEDVLSIVGSVVALVIPVLLLFALAVTAVALVFARRRFRARAERLRG